MLKMVSGNVGFLNLYESGPDYAIMELTGAALQGPPSMLQVLGMLALRTLSGFFFEDRKGAEPSP